VPRGLAVEGDHALDRFRQRRHVAADAGLEAGRIEQPEDPRDVVDRNGVRETQEPAQERRLAAPEERHVDAALDPHKGREERDHHDLVLLVALGIAGSRILEIGKARPQSLHPAAPLVLRRQDQKHLSTQVDSTNFLCDSLPRRWISCLSI
jgi:hypothetical protein